MDMLMQLVLFGICVVAFGTFALYNGKILNMLLYSRDAVDKWYYKYFGRLLKRLQVLLSRQANLNKESFAYTVYYFYDEIITNLDMKKDNVTVAGLLLFITCFSMAAGVVIGVLINSTGLIPVIFASVFYLLTVVLRFLGLMHYEELEAEIMDSVDLLVSDIGGGVYNAVLKYKDSFHPNIRPYFYEFIDNIQSKGFSFTQAMSVLNSKLGHNFDDFALKAVLFEDKADDSMDDIFSAMVEKNRQRRMLRYINNIKFRELTTAFTVSFILILGYSVFSMLFDPFIFYFITEHTFGKLLIVFDIILVAFVLSYIAAIKAKAL